MARAAVMQGRRKLRLAMGMMLCALACNCRAPARHASNTTQGVSSAAAEASYVAPPQLLKATPSVAGVIILRGIAAPHAAIQLQSPEGDAQSTTARADGTWSLALPTIVRPRMFALSQVLNGRVVHAEGALIVLPRPAPAALLARAGFGSLVIQPHGPTPTLVTVDYDPGGFAAFSGTAKPGGAVRLSLDGAPAGLAQTDSMGRYVVLAANHRLTFGAHQAVIDNEAGEVRRSFVLTPPGPLTSAYQAIAEPGAWRIEWTPSGGGVQTTLVLAPQ